MQPKEWQLQVAKNKLSEVVKMAQQAPQIVTLHGKPTAVVVSCSLRDPNRGALANVLCPVS